MDDIDHALWLECRRRNVLTQALDSAAFVSLRRYARRLQAAGIVADAHEVLSTSVIALTAAAIRRLETNLAATPLPPAPDVPPPPTLSALRRPPDEDALFQILGGFARWGIQQLDGSVGYGVMRDGGVLADAVVAARPQPRSGKLWLSRRLCLVAALASADDGQGLLNLLARARAHPASAAEARDELGVTDEPLPPGLTETTPLTGDNLERFVDWLGSGRRRRGAEQRIRTMRTRILNHLRAQHALDGPVLTLMDVGYAGTIQRTITRIFELEHIAVRVDGAYLLSTPGAVWAIGNGGRASGFLANFGAPEWFTTEFIASREVVESLCASGDGPLIGYHEDGTALCGAPRIPSAQRIVLTARHQAVRAQIAATPVAMLPTADQARQACFRLLTAPTATEAAEFGQWIYDDPLAVGAPRRLTECRDPATGTPLWRAAAAITAPDTP